MNDNVIDSMLCSKSLLAAVDWAAAVLYRLFGTLLVTVTYSGLDLVAR